MADSDEGAMEKEVHMTVQIIVRKGEPLPEEKPRPKTSGSDDKEGEGDDGEGEGDGEGGEPEGEAEPKPTLEELGVKFVLTTFNGVTLERSECV
jgi:hypothetical protein